MKPRSANSAPDLQPPSWPVYLRSLGVTLGVIYPLATLQMISFYGRPAASFYLMPTLVGLIVGMLLGRTAVLKQRLARKNLQFRAVADLAQELTCFRRLDGSYEYVSPSSREITGHEPEDFYRDPGLMERLIHPADRERWAEHVATRAAQTQETSLDLRLITKNGRLVWVNHQSGPVFDSNGHRLGTRSTNMDITDRKRATKRIEYLAYHDRLTGLPNRLEIVRRLQVIVEQHRATPDAPGFALLAFDLLRFKNINDSFGRLFGDDAIRLVAHRLSAVQPPDSVLGRIEGDEFVLIVPGIANSAAAELLANRMLGEVERPLHIHDSEIYLSCSIGYALFPLDGDVPETLLRNATVAVTRAKNELTTHIGNYREGMIDAVHHFVTTEHRLHQGLKNAEFLPYYQPIVDLKSGAITGLEALVRWQHPERGLIPPGEFLPVAEATGQITQLGEYLFGHILTDLRNWEDAGLRMPVSVNLSVRQFADPRLCERLNKQLAASGCDVELVRLEITEQVFIGDLALARQRLESFRDAGFEIALDDFGTGYSSFHYLKHLPISSLKIDRDFVVDLETHTRSRAILRAISGVCRELELEVVVEGVDTQAQRETLLELGFSRAQGFAFHRPKPAAEISQLLLHEHTSASAPARFPQSRG